MKNLLYFTIIVSLIGTAIYATKIYSNKQNSLSNLNLTGNYTNQLATASFHGKNLEVPKIKEKTTDNKILGSRNQKKRIEIDLTNQRIYAFQGETKIFDFLVSTGKWGRTPTGEFTIWVKLKYTLMSGGSKALGTYYYLPNVPYTMYFYNFNTPKSKGYGIHGTYWHDNFGHPMSHGCINMKTEEAEQLFYWANPEIEDKEWSKYTSNENPGTKIYIYGTAPNE